MKVGVIACAAISNEIKRCVSALEGSFKIYPVPPSCFFSVKTDVFEDFLEKSTSENNITLVAYGICHSEILTLVEQYKGTIRLSANNCFEMLIGSLKYSEYHRKCYWMFYKSFLTAWRRELFSGMEAGRNYGTLLMRDGINKLVYIKFEHEKADEKRIKDFASAVGLDYEIYQADTANLRELLAEALVEALAEVSAMATQISNAVHFSIPEDSEVRTILENIDEIIYKIDIPSRRFVFVSPQVENILGYSQSEFIDIMNDYLQIPIYHEEDRVRVTVGRYRYLVRCESGKMQSSFEHKYRMNHRNGSLLRIQENIYPVYRKGGALVSFIGKVVDITEHEETDKELLRYANTQKELVREVNHRIKNNLATIISMLRIEKERKGSAEYRSYQESFDNLEWRIRGLSVVQDLLSAGGWRPLNICALCNEIIRGILMSIPSSAKADYEVVPSEIVVDSDQAHYLALVISELVTNTVKHSLKGRDSLKIVVTVERCEQKTRIRYKDDGQGYPWEIRNGKLAEEKIGLRIIEGIVKISMNGTVNFFSKNGAVAEILF